MNQALYIEISYGLLYLISITSYKTVIAITLAWQRRKQNFVRDLPKVMELVSGRTGFKIKWSYVKVSRLNHCILGESDENNQEGMTQALGRNLDDRYTLQKKHGEKIF